MKASEALKNGSMRLTEEDRHEIAVLVAEGIGIAIGNGIRAVLRAVLILVAIPVIGWVGFITWAVIVRDGVQVPWFLVWSFVLAWGLLWAKERIWG